MSDTPKRVAFTQRTQPSLIDLASAMTGVGVDMSMVQITDQKAFARVSAMMMQCHEMGTQRQIEGRMQDDGALHVYLLEQSRIITGTAISKGSWRVLTQAQFDEIAKQVDVSRSPEADQMLREELSASMEKQRLRSAHAAEMGQHIQSMLLVATRNLDGTALMANAVDLMPEYVERIDAFLAGAATYMLLYTTPNEASRFCMSARDSADLVGPVLDAIVQRAGSIGAAMLVLADLGKDVEEQFTRAWLLHGGVTTDRVIDQALADSGNIPANEHGAMDVDALNDSPKMYLTIPRSCIEADDLSPLLEELCGFTSSHAVAVPFRGAMAFHIDGYNDDPRMLWDIPEVRTFMVRLWSHWPYWFYFMRRNAGEFRLLIALLCGGKERITGNDSCTFSLLSDDVIRIVKEGLAGQEELFSRWGLKSDHPEFDLVRTELLPVLQSLLEAPPTLH